MVAKEILDKISFEGLKYKYLIVQRGYFKDRLYSVEGLISEFDPSFDIENDLRPVAINYEMRSFQEGLPYENNYLVYGKIQKVFNGEIAELGEILHLSELLNDSNELVMARERDISSRKKKLKYNPKLVNEGYSEELMSAIKNYKKNGFEKAEEKVGLKSFVSNIFEKINKK